MADRYLARIARSSEASCDKPGPLCAPSGLKTVYNGRANVLVTGESTTIELPDEGGIIIGRLFAHDDQMKAVKAVDQAESRRLQDLDHLLSNYWGGYLAIIRSENGEVDVLRDPSGTLPCYFIECGDEVVFASDPDILMAEGLWAPKLHWPSLVRHFVAYDLQTEATPLSGLRELLPGHRCRVSPKKTVAKPHWSPWSYTQRHPLPDQPERLRHTVRACVQAWASTYDSILLNVSGGLDSSIVGACLKGTQANVTCLTFATEQADGDERVHARLLAQHLGFELVEHIHNLKDIDITQPTTAHMARPIGHAFVQSKRAIESRLTQARSIDALFNGIGGDNIFCSLQSATPILDRLMAEGVGTGALKTLKDICDLAECSAFDAAAMVAKRALSFERRYRWRPDTSFLSTDAVMSAAIDLDHPWLKAPAKALPGKAVHISLLLRVLSTLDMLPPVDPATQLSPLLSQPIVELCLQIPSWEWFGNGMNRIIARRAFQNDLPSALLERRTKGTAASFVHDVLDTNRDRLRSLLLDGLLASERIVDTTLLAAALHPNQVLKPRDLLRLSSLAEAEVWARHWQSIARSGLKRG